MTEFLGLDEGAWKVIGLTVGTAVAAVFGRRKLMIMASSDSVRIQGHEATKSVYQTLRDENDRLRSIIDDLNDRVREMVDRVDRAYEERNTALMELAGLRSEARILRDHCVRLELKVQEMQEHIEKRLRHTGD